MGPNGEIFGRIAPVAASTTLGLLVEGDPGLYNIYHVIVVNPDKHKEVNVAGARAFAKFITSASTQEIIAKFGVDKYGQALFVPDAGRSEAEVGL